MLKSFAWLCLMCSIAAIILIPLSVHLKAKEASAALPYVNLPKSCTTTFKSEGLQVFQCNGQLARNGGNLYTCVIVTAIYGPQRIAMECDFAGD